MGADPEKQDVDSCNTVLRLRNLGQNVDRGYSSISLKEVSLDAPDYCVEAK